MQHAGGWPSLNLWASVEFLYVALIPCSEDTSDESNRWQNYVGVINSACSNLGAGPDNSPAETTAVGQRIQVVANNTNVDPRLIFAVMMQESELQTLGHDLSRAP